MEKYVETVRKSYILLYYILLNMKNVKVDKQKDYKIKENYLLGNRLYFA